MQPIMSSKPQTEAQLMIYQPTETSTSHDKPNSNPYSQGSHRLLQHFSGQTPNFFF